MKKALSLLVLLLILLSFPVSAASGRLTAASVSGKVGEQVTVTVRLDNPGIIATRIFVRYDSAVLRLDSAENGEVFEKSHAVFGKDIHADPYTMLWDDSLRTDNVTTSGTLCTLQFTIVKAPSGGETNVRIAVDKSSTFDVDLNEVTVADATCTVKTGGSAPSAPAATAKQPAADTTAAKPYTTDASASTAAEKSGKITNPITAAPGKAKSTAALSASTTVPSADTPTASASAAASSAAAPTEPAGTTAGAFPQTVPDLGTTAAPAGDADVSAAQTEKNAAMEAASSDTLSESGVLTIGAAEEETSRHVHLLWLLVLVPVAAVLLFVIFKKKK